MHSFLGRKLLTYLLFLYTILLDFLPQNVVFFLISSYSGNFSFDFCAYALSSVLHLQISIRINQSDFCLNSVQVL